MSQCSNEKQETHVFINHVGKRFKGYKGQHAPWPLGVTLTLASLFEVGTTIHIVY